MNVALGGTLTPAVTRRTAFYNNTCTGAYKSMSNFGLATVRDCPVGYTTSRECAGVAIVDVGERLIREARF